MRQAWGTTILRLPQAFRRLLIRSRSPLFLFCMNESPKALTGGSREGNVYRDEGWGVRIQL